MGEIATNRYLLIETDEGGSHNRLPKSSEQTDELAPNEDDSLLRDSASSSSSSIDETIPFQIGAVIVQGPKVDSFCESDGELRKAEQLSHYSVVIGEDIPLQWSLVTARISEERYKELVLEIHEQYAEALRAHTLEETLDKAFHAYHTSAFAMLSERGSAAMNHFCLQTVLLAKNYLLPPAREGYAPDLEALASTESEWPQHARFVFQISEEGIRQD